MKKNNIILAVCAIVSMTQMSYGMLRRLAPRTVALATIAQHRQLLPGQEKEKPWIEINEKIDAMLKKHGVVLTKAEMADMSKTGEAIRKTFVDSGILFVGGGIALRLKDERILTIIHKALEKHGIDHQTMQFLEARETDFVMAVDTISRMFLVNLAEVQDKSDDFVLSVIEHEIGHLVCNDSAWRKAFDKAVKDKTAQEAFHLLKEQRADTHSALQSLSNALLLPGYYSLQSQENGLQQWFKVNAPDLLLEDMKSKSFYDLCSILYKRGLLIQFLTLLTNNYHGRLIVYMLYKKFKMYGQVAVVCIALELYILCAVVQSILCNDEESQEKVVEPIRIQKGWFGRKPGNDQIWNQIGRETEYQVTRDSYTYEIIDDGPDWKVVFAKK